MLHLDNLSSVQMKKGVMPWEFKPVQPIPEEVRKDKKLRDAWINRPSTKHFCFTLFEGVNGTLRVSSPKGDGGNPAYLAHGLVGDYDAPADEAAVLAFASKLPIPPNWIERTLSGNWRFVWLFEKPILFPSHAFAVHFLATFAEFAFDPSRGMIGFDEGAWLAPERIYTTACDWRPLNPKPIPASITEGWHVQASNKFKWVDMPGSKVPLDIVKAELAKKYPKFSEWPGEFALGSQGPSFWIDGSTSPKSAIVREKGIQTFSDHATKGFYNWADLLSIDFVKQFETENFAKLTKDIVWNGKHYYRLQPDACYKPYDDGKIRTHLRGRGASPKLPKGGGLSELEQCLEYIHDHQQVDIAATFPLRPTGIIDMEGERVLNISSRRVMSPAPGTAVWGPKGQFAWLSYFLERFFSTREQLDFWLSHTAHFYKAGLDLKPVQGQAIFLVGPPGTGKGLLGTGIAGPIFGGYKDASDYLTGSDPFGGELFSVAVWVVGDAVSTIDARSHRNFSERVKKTVANREFRANTKFLKADTIQWRGRLYVSLNDDAKSIRMIPDLEISIREKLLLFRTVDTGIEFPSEEKLKEILARELPHLCRYLLDWVIPDHCLGPKRFGLVPYHEPSLVESARLNSSTSGFAELLADWMKDYFTVREPKAEFWKGTALQLQKEFLLDPTAQVAVRPYTIDLIGEYLGALMAKDAFKIESTFEGETRIWKIYNTSK